VRYFPTISFFLACLFLSRIIIAQDVFITENAEVVFISEAPLEIIIASSKTMKVGIDLTKKTFTFVINNNSFEGFNSDLQREHFLENYIQAHQYSSSTFEGKIVEDFDLSKDGQYLIRAKGTMNIHGVSVERIIKSTLIKEGDSLQIFSEFSLPLEEHNIKIPRLVNQKIAKVILIKVEAGLKPLIQ
jgi:YceI-like protein